jgi:hypothetical protein
MKNPEKRAYFTESCSRLMINPEMTTTFDWLEADDAKTSWPTTPTIPISVSTENGKLNSAIGDQTMQTPDPNSIGAPLFGPSLYRIGGQTPSPGRKSKPRKNPFYKSREDRGTRQAKTMNRSRTQPRGR